MPVGSKLFREAAAGAVQSQRESCRRAAENLRPLTRCEPLPSNQREDLAIAVGKGGKGCGEGLPLGQALGNRGLGVGDFHPLQGGDGQVCGTATLGAAEDRLEVESWGVESGEAYGEAL